MLRAIDRLESFQKAISKAHLVSTGVSIDSLDHKPLIAVVNSWSEICPEHEPLKQLAEEVKKGILEVGGGSIEFNTVATRDGIAQGHSGMRYCPPHREIITDSIEAMVAGEGVFDGVVYMGSCDKIVPGMLNTTARTDLPSVIVTAGPCYVQIKPGESKELRQQFLRGGITERQLIEGMPRYYTGPGIRPSPGTANIVGALCESLGMMLPGGGLIPSGISMRRFSARESGRVVMRMVEKQIRPSQIMIREALENTITLLSAIGGSLNVLIHLPALAAELGIPLDWDDFSKITTATPVSCSIVPNGNRTVVNLHYAGGIPAVTEELESVMNKDVLTVTGETLGWIPERTSQGSREAIESTDDSVSRVDGTQVPYGNLVPQGALVKTSVVPMEIRRSKGTARVLEDEDECYVAFRAEEIKEGDAAIVCYEGSKGGPGTKELHRITEIIKGIPNTAVITDGCFSEASGGLSIGYLRPEAAEGGPTALVKDGGRITVDLYEGYLRLEASDEELEARRREWKAVRRPREKGPLGRHARLMNTARSGATLSREQRKRVQTSLGSGSMRFTLFFDL